jgi:hypothetical protein
MNIDEQLVQEVDALNLANQHGSEGELSKKMLEQAERYGQLSTGLRLVPFDFHKECGASRYDRCCLLYPESTFSRTSVAFRCWWRI